MQMSSASSANVARFLEKQAFAQPDGAAVLAPSGRDREGAIHYERISFAELHGQSEQLAHALRDAGLRPGMRTLLMVKPGSDLIRCCFALFKLGAVPVVIDPGMGLRQFPSCVRRTRPEALVGIPIAHVVSRLFPGAFRSVKWRIKVGKGFSNWFGSFPATGFPIFKPSADEMAAILFTSGSTGPPKGVCYGHGQFDAQVGLIHDSFAIEPGEVDLPMLPVFSLFNPALGMTTVVPEINPGKPAKVDPRKILQAIRQCKVTNSFGSPVLWSKIARHAEQTGESFPTMKRILMAGAPVSPALVRRLQPVFPAARLWSPYGATECLPVSAIDGDSILAESDRQSQAGSGTCVGFAVAGVEIRIISIREGAIPGMNEVECLPTGEIGEIIATGPTVTTSYDGLPEATRRAKIHAGDGRVWHRMGDAGYLDQNGRLWFCGRIAERVITREGPLYTDCVEGIFNDLQGVSRSALIGIGRPPDQEPAIVIEPEPGHAMDSKTLLDHARKNPQSSRIKRVYFRDSFPVDVRHNAKINRLELARIYRNK